MTTIKVHGSFFSTATLRVLASLNEKSLDYEFVPVDMRSGEHKKDPFLSLNYPRIQRRRRWRTFEAQRYEPPAAKLTWELGIKPVLGMATDDDVVKAQVAELAKVIDVYEPRLAHSKYLGGDAFSLADLHHLPTLKYLMASPVKAVFEARPHVAAWVADIMARPSWQKVLAC
ncbi:hypothetical protein SASPL_157486 [Salvia splendens]|uniref:glutathione transferase n=1 Tax=Salvia splendens TaxID=180675 RepID=A0A8X8VUT1_SALSN|nr:hypothetical protein SASPL_157486 [Salvia splendens]